MGYTSLALRSMFGTNNGIAGQVLVGFGTDEQKAHWLERMATGEVVASFALTEPGAGSNPSGLRTKAVRDGRTTSWIINGQKRFITNAPIADLFVVFARTRPADDDGPGIAVFLVPAGHRRRRGRRQGRQDGPGGRVDGRRQLHRRPGARRRAGRRQRGHRLPGGDDLAWRAAASTSPRWPSASLSARSTNRSPTPPPPPRAAQPIGNFQLVQAMLADQQTGVLAGRALVRDTARLWVTGEDRRIAPSAAKLFCTEMAGKVADLAVQIHGGSGYMREVPVERIYRDVRLLRLYEGTSEIQRLIIGGESREGGTRKENMSGRLTDKVAFITGAARGQGRAHAVRMANEGADIIAVDLAGQLPALRSLPLGDPGGPRRDGASGRRPPAGASSPRSSTPATSTACARPSTTVSPNSAGSTSSSPTPGSRLPQAWNAITPEAFRDVMDINVTGTWNTVMAGAQKIIDGGRGGSIILISSAAGIKLQPFMIHYTASKHAVTGMARAFAAELGKHSIRVNSVHPGPVVTAMGMRRHGRAVTKAGETNPQLGPIHGDAVPARPGSRSPRTSPTRCAGWPATNRNIVTAAAISVDQGATQS